MLRCSIMPISHWQPICQCDEHIVGVERLLVNFPSVVYFITVSGVLYHSQWLDYIVNILLELELEYFITFR